MNQRQDSAAQPGQSITLILSGISYPLWTHFYYVNSGIIDPDSQIWPGWPHVGFVVGVVSALLGFATLALKRPDFTRIVYWAGALGIITHHALAIWSLRFPLSLILLLALGLNFILFAASRMSILVTLGCASLMLPLVGDWSGTEAGRLLMIVLNGTSFFSHYLLFRRKMIRFTEEEHEAQSTDALVNAVPGMVSWVDRDLNYVKVNSGLADFYRIPVSEFVGKPLGFLSETSVRESLRTLVATFFESGLEESQIDWSIQEGAQDPKAPGEKHHYLLYLRLYNSGQEVVIVGLDQTSRVQAQNMAALSQDRLNLALAAVGISACEWNLETRELVFDRQFFAILGLDPDELLNRHQGLSAKDGKFRMPLKYFRENFLFYFHPDDFRVFGRQLRLGLERASEWSSQFRIIRDNGQLRICRANARVYFGESAKPSEIVWVVWDVTTELEAAARVEAERLKSLSASKMASLGEMSGGIAHEINNPLAVIVGKAQQIRSWIEMGKVDQERLLKAIDSIEKTGGRIAKIVKGLRAFARDGQQDPFVLTPLKDIVEDTLAFCQSKLTNHEVDLRVDPIDPELRIACRSVQVSQVLLNLIGNAADAIATRDVRWVHIQVLKTDTQLKIIVTDSGPGIPEAIREKIMQPFFTTKEPGKGTGLGLSISAQILRDHEGRLWIDHECSNTRFVLEFPIPKEETASKDDQAA